MAISDVETNGVAPAPEFGFNDWLACYNLLNDWASAYDTKTLTSLSKIFTPTITADYSALPIPPPAGLGKDIPLENLVAFLSPALLNPEMRTLHQLSNVKITPTSPTTASATAAICARHWFGRGKDEQEATGYGRNRWGFVRDAEGRWWVSEIVIGRPTAARGDLGGLIGRAEGRVGGAH